MNFLKKLKLAAGFQLEEKKHTIKDTYCEIEENDTIDVIFAKNLIKNNGNFFYCEKKLDLIKTINALRDSLNINVLVVRASCS